ncbi:hypothetical protein [Tychonema sp. LEGE 07203]|uniref:hypothetical protein n=1 Tax=Tychonema sp. LEGE 07203 TaxID=1828671 RepID=UPI001D13FEE0|nr:hypothetical protein [Tychonema sp. LEGE 07203]
MHKIVWVSVGVLTLFFVTYPIAMWRVSQKEKFLGSHVKSFTVEGQKSASAVANKPAETTAANISAPIAADNLAAGYPAEKMAQKPLESVPFTNNSAQRPVTSNPADKTVRAAPVSAAKQEVVAVDGTNQTAEITDRAKLDELALKVYDRIDRSWQTSPTFTQNLVYRISASQEGAIANFEPLNQPAKDYTQETPLPNLLKSAETSSSSTTPVAKLTVVFAPAGTLEVNP